MHTDEGIRACTGCPHLPAPPTCTQAHAHVLTHSSLSPHAPRPRPFLPAPSRVVCHQHVRTPCPPGRALPVAMAMLCLPGDEVCSPLCSEGSRAAGGPADTPALPGCPALLLKEWLFSGCTSSAQDPDPQFWAPAASQAMDLLSASPEHVSFGGTSSPHHGQLPSASCMTQEQALPSVRQDLDSLDLLHSPHHCTAPRPACGACSISRAHQDLPAPPCRMHHQGFPVLTRAGTDPAGFHAEWAGCCLCHNMPCPWTHRTGMRHTWGPYGQPHTASVPVSLTLSHPWPAVLLVQPLHLAPRSGPQDVPKISPGA